MFTMIFNQFVSQKYILFALFELVKHWANYVKKIKWKKKSMTDYKASAYRNGHRYRFSPNIPIPLAVPNPNNDYSSIIY